MKRKVMIGTAAVVAIGLSLALAFAAGVVQPLVQVTPSSSNNLTLTFLTRHNSTSRFSELGLTSNYNGFVYLVQGLDVKLFRVERNVVEQGENRTTTITETLAGQGTTNVGGEVSFTVAPGYYYVKLVHGDRQVRLPDLLLVFSDRSVYVPLDQLFHRVGQRHPNQTGSMQPSLGGLGLLGTSSSLDGEIFG